MLVSRPAPATTAGPRIGSVCSGYGGLDLAVMHVFGGSLAWVADPDPAAARILACHWPHSPNLGDITVVDWHGVESVDIVCGGYPCQPFSCAGQRRGTEDERHLWPYIADALRILRPEIAIFENVAGHLRRGFDTVLADLAALGFDAQWAVVPASAVGAPHKRERLFVLATAQNPDRPASGQWRITAPGQEENRRARPDARGRGRAPAADAGHGDEPERARPSRRPDRQRPPERQIPQPDHPQPVPNWGIYAPAIRRWEALTRPAPRPTEPARTGERLSPAFAEWMMGLPEGWVTGVPGLSRNAQLRAIGNGVVPQAGAHALALLADRDAEPAAV